jgi:hypothetical protein
VKSRRRRQRNPSPVPIKSGHGIRGTGYAARDTGHGPPPDPSPEDGFGSQGEGSGPQGGIRDRRHGARDSGLGTPAIRNCGFKISEIKAPGARKTGARDTGNGDLKLQIQDSRGASAGRGGRCPGFQPTSTKSWWRTMSWSERKASEAQVRPALSQNSTSKTPGACQRARRRGRACPDPAGAGEGACPTLAGRWPAEKPHEQVRATLAQGRE